MSGPEPVVPKEFDKIAHRYDQYTRCEVSVYANKHASPLEVMIVVDGKASGPYSKGQLESIKDCLNMDVDFKRPGVF
jgi:hypothetical protein